MRMATGMTLLSQSDQDLVASARAGDERAFEELYGRYRQRIKTFAMRLTGSPDRADDVTQEVFISALRRLRETDRPIIFRPWIYEIARNACIDDYRRSRRAQEVPFERDGMDGWLTGVSTAPSPEVAMESKQKLEHLRGAFRGLSERHHRVIVLRELEGLSYSQIGDQLGMSKMVVESTLFRARRRLSEEYEDLESGRRCVYVQQLLASDRGRSLRQLGLRDRRALSRHIEHCQPCRREAAAAGVYEELESARPLRKVAVLLPFPLVALLRRAGIRAAGLARSIHHAGFPLASSGGGTVMSIELSGRFAATAATVLLAAVGGGVIGGVASSGGASRSSGPAAHDGSAARRAGVRVPAAAGPSAAPALAARSRRDVADPSMAAGRRGAPRSLRALGIGAGAIAAGAAGHGAPTGTEAAGEQHPRSGGVPRGGGTQPGSGDVPGGLLPAVTHGSPLSGGSAESSAIAGIVGSGTPSVPGKPGLPSPPRGAPSSPPVFASSGASATTSAVRSLRGSGGR